MATIAYRGEFTVRDGGRDLPARISVGTADMLSSQSWTPFLLSGDPVVLTWEECALTDVIHRSQLQLNLIAENDGDYRDLTQSAEAIYCLLEVDAGSGFSRWWVGAYADTTWLEPFSRERGYDVQMTFSDFGYLERLDYDGSNFGSTAQGAADVGSIVSWLVSLFSGSVSLPEVRWMPMPSARMNNSALPDLLVRDVMFTDDDGTPRNMLDILTDVLEPANVHIMQYGGKVWLFSPDYGAYFDAGDYVSGTLEAAGTDAELESCGSYRRAELEFSPSGSISHNYEPEKTDFIYDTYASIYYYYGVNSLLMAKMDAYPQVRALAYTDGSTELMELLWLSSRDPLDWHDVVPNVPQSVFPTFILTNHSSIEIMVSPDDLSPNEIIKKQYKATISLWGLFVRNDGEYLQFAQVRTDVEWTSLSGQKKYWRKETGSASSNQWMDSPATDDSMKPSAIFNGSSGGKGGRFDLSITLSEVPGPGRMHIDFLLSTIGMNDSDGSTAWGSRPAALGLCGVSASTVGYLDTSVLDLTQSRIVEISQTASDVFSKSFKMGTIERASVDSIYNYVDPEASVTVPEGQTFLDKYADFIELNYKVTEDTPVRRRVRGSYMYAHTEGFPLFLAESAAPLNTLQRDDRAFFLMSEQWRLRTGIAQLVLEEASLVPPSGVYLYVRPESLEIASGTDGVLHVLTNGYGDILLYVTPAGLTVSPVTITGRGEITLTLTADDNLGGEPVEYVLLFRDALLSTILLMVSVTVSPASDVPISISDSLFEVPAHGGTFQLSLTSSTSWEVAVSDSAGLGVKVSPSEGRTGESSPEVTVSGLAARNDREAVVTFSDKWGNMADLTLMQRGQRIADGITEDIVLDADETELVREVPTNADAVRVEIEDALWARLESAYVQVNGEDLVKMQPSVPAVANVCGDAEGAKLFFIMLYFRSGIAGVVGTVTGTAMFGDEEVPIAEIRVSDAAGLMTEDGGLLMTEDGQYNILLG